MGSGDWLARRERECVPYCKETWAERWERKTGIRPDVKKVRTRGPGLFTHAYKFGAEQ